MLRREVLLAGERPARERPNVRRRDYVVAAVLFMAMVGALSAPALSTLGCGPSGRQLVVQSSLQAANTARDAFVQVDRSLQKAIVEQAPTVDLAQDGLRAYRERRDRVLIAFASAYSAIAAAAADVGADSLADMARALADLRDEVTALQRGEGR